MIDVFVWVFDQRQITRIFCDDLRSEYTIETRGKSRSEHEGC